MVPGLGAVLLTQVTTELRAGLARADWVVDEAVTEEHHSASSAARRACLTSAA